MHWLQKPVLNPNSLKGRSVKEKSPDIYIISGDKSNIFLIKATNMMVFIRGNNFISFWFILHHDGQKLQGRQKAIQRKAPSAVG